MAAHLRKPCLKRVATEDDTPYPAPGIKKVKFVSPEYKIKHNIGRRKTSIVTYNERILQYEVMAKARKESETKGKISKKTFLNNTKEQSVRISGKSCAVKKGSVASSTLKSETRIPTTDPPRSISMPSTSEASVSAASASTKIPVASPLTKIPVASPLTKIPVASPLTKIPVASPMTKIPVASRLTKIPVANAMKKKPVASAYAKKHVESAAAKKPVANTCAKKPVASTSAEKPVGSTSAKKPVVGTSVEKPVASASAEKPIASTSAKKPVVSVYAEKPVADTTAKKVPTVAGTTAKKVPTVAGTTAKKVPTVAGTTAKKVPTVAGTTAKKVPTVAGTTAKKVPTVAGTTAKKVPTVAGTTAKKVTSVAGITAKKMPSVAGRPIKKVTTVAGRPIKKVTTVASTPTKVTTVAGTPAKKVPTVAGTPTKKVTTVAGTPAKKVTTLAGTPTKKMTTLAGTPAKKMMTLAGTPAKKMMTVAGTPAKKVMSVAGTPAKKVTTVAGTPAKKVTFAGTPAKKVTTVVGTPAKKVMTVTNTLAKATAVSSSPKDAAARKTSVASSSSVDIFGMTLPRKIPINHCLKETSTKTRKKQTSNYNLEESPDTSLPSISNSNRCNLLQANQCRELSVHLVRLRREASLNAAAKVNLIYNENQSKASGKQAHASRSGNQHRVKNAQLVKKCKFKGYKFFEQSLFSKVSKSKKNDCSFNPISKANKLLKLKVSRSCNKGTCIKKTKLVNNKIKAVTTMQNKLNEQIENSSTLCHLPVKQTLQNKTKLKSNNSNEGFNNKSKQLNGYECRKDCIACHIEAKDYGVDCVDKTNRNYRSKNLCSFNVSCLEGYTIDNSALREKHPECFQLAHNKQKHYSAEKKLLSKCVKVCQSKDIEVDYSSPKEQLESYLTDYGNLKGYRPDKLGASNNDALSVAAQNTCPNSYQNLKNVIRNHNLHFDNSPTTMHLSSNLYGSKGSHQYGSDKNHCCTATPLDFCQAKCNNQALEESPGKLSKRMASLNAQAIMDVCQEPRPSKREFLQNSQRAARTHYIFSPKRQSCRWVDGLGMFLTSDLQNPSTNDLKQKIIVSCTATSTNSSSVIGSNISSSKSSLITSGNNCSPDIQVQAEIHERLKEKSDKTFKATPKKSNPAQFSQFNNVLSSQGRPEMVSGCSSFPYIHGENVSPTQCQTFTLNGIGSISNLRSLPYQPYGSPFSVPCNLGSIPHCYYPSDSCYPHSSAMVQPIPKSCVITSPIPIHVPHAEVKVLIHNPHPSQPFIQTADSPKLKKSRKGNQIPKTKTVDNQQKNISKRKTEIFKSKPKLGKRNCDLNIISEKIEKSSSPSKRKKPNSSNCGWSWEGEPEMKPVLSLNIDDPPSERKCYPAIKHTDGELIRVRDCVLLRSGPRKKDLPYTAKVVAFWENTTDGEMMMSLLWYYRPEHTESGRQPHNIDCEVFASKHRDINSVACIEEKCYVLTFNEYCRYKAEVRRSESNFPARRKVVPTSENYPRLNRLPPVNAAAETVFLCRKVYHFRQKRILKN